MVKKILITFGCLILIVVVAEVIALVRLKLSVKSYATFWQQYPKEGEFTLVVLGDSAAQGIGASQPMKGYVGLLSKQIKAKTGKSVWTYNRSVTGAKVSDVTNNQLPQISGIKPDVLIVEIGSNNMRNYDENTFKADYALLASKLPPGTLVSNIPYFGGRDKNNSSAIRASKIIADAAEKYGLKLVDLQTQTREDNSIRNYAADYFHPSNKGYRNWYAAFWKVIEPQL